jgi:hypothetical protein
MKIRNFMNRVRINVKKYVTELLEEYMPSMYNDGLMRDIRKLYYLNADKEDMAEFIYEKGKQYARVYKKKVRTRSEIEKCIENFIQKCTFKWRNPNRFDLSGIMKLLC